MVTDVNQRLAEMFYPQLRYEVEKDDAGEWRWRIRHKNQDVLADSGEGYKNKDDCLRGLLSIANVNDGTEVWYGKERPKENIETVGSLRKKVKP